MRVIIQTGWFPCPQCDLVIGNVVLRTGATVPSNKDELLLADGGKVECPSCKKLCGHVEVKFIAELPPLGDPPYDSW